MWIVLIRVAAVAALVGFLLPWAGPWPEAQRPEPVVGLQMGLGYYDSLPLIMIAFVLTLIGLFAALLVSHRGHARWAKPAILFTAGAAAAIAYMGMQSFNGSSRHRQECQTQREYYEAIGDTLMHGCNEPGEYGYMFSMISLGFLALGGVGLLLSRREVQAPT